MCTSVKRFPSYRDFWSSAPDLHDEYISRTMSVKRFNWLLSHVHFNDNQLLPKRGEANYDKLYKIRPLLDYNGQNYFNSYRPHGDVVISATRGGGLGLSYPKICIAPPQKKLIQFKYYLIHKIIFSKF